MCGRHIICYAVLTSPKKGETAVHGCNPTLSVSVVLVSRKINFLRNISLAVFVFLFNLHDNTKTLSQQRFCTWPRLKTEGCDILEMANLGILTEI